jgi:hypothetical protein
MRAIAIVLALTLAACAGGGAEPVEADSGNAGIGGHVTYKYTGEDTGEAHAQASAYCGKYRKRAWLRSTGQRGEDKVATFDCR